MYTVLTCLAGLAASVAPPPPSGIDVRLVAALEGHEKTPGGVTVCTSCGIKDFPGAVLGLAFSPDGKLLASAGADGTVRVWDVRRTSLLRTLRCGKGRVHGVAFHPAGKHLVSAGADLLTVWDVGDGTQVRQVKLDGRVLSSLAFSRDGKTLAAGTMTCPPLETRAMSIGRCEQAGPVHLLDWASLRPRSQPIPKGCHVLFTPDGDSLLTGGLMVEPLGGKPADGFHRTALWDLDAGLVRQSWLGQGDVTALSADGRFVATGQGIEFFYTRGSRVLYNSGWAADDRLGVREASTGGELFRWAMKPLAVAFSPDGRLLVAASETEVCVFSLTSGEVLARRRAPAHAFCLSFSPNGSLLALGGTDNVLELWQVRDNRPLPPPTRLDRAAAERTWQNLANTSAAVGHRSVLALVSAKDQGFKLIEERLSPVGPASGAQRLLARLNSDRFEEREDASRALEKMGFAVEGVLRQALAGKLELEVRRRVQRLLARLKPDHPERLREERAIAVLEMLGSPAACRHLRLLASGEASARPTRLARAALERLDRRGAR